MCHHLLQRGGEMNRLKKLVLIINQVISYSNIQQWVKLVVAKMEYYKLKENTTVVEQLALKKTKLCWWNNWDYDTSLEAKDKRIKCGAIVMYNSECAVCSPNRMNILVISISLDYIISRPLYSLTHHILLPKLYIYQTTIDYCSFC